MYSSEENVTYTIYSVVLYLKMYQKERVSNSKSFTTFLRSITGCEEVFIWLSFRQISLQELPWKKQVTVLPPFFSPYKTSFLYPTKLGVSLLMYTQLQHTVNVRRTQFTILRFAATFCGNLQPDGI